jgi:hypothetical protein
MALIPHVSDVERWTKHFVKMADNNSSPRKNNFFVVGGQDPLVKLVTPTAQTVLQAKALLTPTSAKQGKAKKKSVKKKKMKGGSSSKPIKGGKQVKRRTNISKTVKKKKHKSTGRDSLGKI